MGGPNRAPAAGQNDITLVPWPHGGSGHGAFEDMESLDADRMMVFVPAVMSVGLVMSAVALIRDSLQWTRRRARERRTAIEAGAVASEILGEIDPPPRALGVLSRPSYLASAFVLVGAATYLAIGSVANYQRDGGYVSDIGWLLALSLGLAVLLGFLGGVSLAVFWTWPHPPAWTYSSLRTAPLTTTPGRDDEGPSWTLSVSVVASAIATGVISLMVGSGTAATRELDEPIAKWLVETESLGTFATLDFFGSTWVSASFAAFVALSAFRCKVMAVLFPAAFVGTWAGAELLRTLIDRPRPLDAANLGSFPSGHMVQLVFLAGLVPVALAVLGIDRRFVVATQTVLAGAVLLNGLSRVHEQAHWPLDVVAGITFSLTAVLATRWVLAHHHWHQRCARCPWAGHPDHRPWTRGLINLSETAHRRLGRAGIALALVAAAGLGLLVLVAGLPQDPEGYGFGTAIAGPAQYGLAVLMALAALLALRHRASAAFLMMMCATGLGLFASIQYPPRVALALTLALLIPAVLMWLAWQHHATTGSIALLAVITTAVVAGTATGSTMIYNYYFGPTHPSSQARALSSDAAWLWLGGVGPRTATVVAGGLDPRSQAVLHYVADVADVSREVDASGQRQQATVDEYGLARFEVHGLRPATRYRYAVVDGDDGDDGDNRDNGDNAFDSDSAKTLAQADASFTTYAEGPQDLVVVVGSCARTGSNGAVFDAMAAENPNLYLALGDLHYSNLASSDPADHIRQYRATVSQPGQSALVRSVPTAYAWDDHDYGPNNSDANSPSRLGVGTAYRRAVPHYGVDPDPGAAISQAFSVGRVRFVFTDNRSQRTADTLLGPKQEAWLINELTASARTHALVVWGNPTPWISAGGADDWSNYPEQRRRISDALVRADVDNMIMVSGDAHMVAIDDGTNSGYATKGGPGFPVLHAAALDRPGNTKGGPYSEGAFPGAGQYGLLRVDDDGGDTITVRLAGRTWEGKELVAIDLTFPA